MMSSAGQNDAASEEYRKMYEYQQKQSAAQYSAYYGQQVAAQDSSGGHGQHSSTAYYGDKRREADGKYYEMSSGSKRSDRYEDRYRDRDYRDRDRDRDRRDRDRDYRQSSRDYRDKDRSDRDRYRDKDRDRYRDKDRDREYRDRDKDRDNRSSRRSSRSPQSRHRRDKSPSPAAGDDAILPLSQWPRKLRNWDMPPPGYEHLTVAQVKAAGLFPLPGQSTGTGEMAMSQMAQMNPTSQHVNFAKQARRIYMGNLPPGINEKEITEFLHATLGQLNDHRVVEGCPVVAVSINRDKNFAFVEMRTAEEATLSLGFDGIMCQGHELKLRRPKDFGPMGGVTGSNMVGTVGGTVLAGGMSEIISTVPDTPNRIFIGNLPTYLADDQVRELLEAFGELKSFHLVKDGATGVSKGYAFCEYLNPDLTDIACAGLNDMELGEDKLFVQRSREGGVRMLTLMGASPASGLLATVALSASDFKPTRIVMLLNMVAEQELRKDENYEEIKEDIEEECKRYGNVVKILIARPVRGQQVPGVGRVYVEYETEDESKQAVDALSGRRFADRVVVTAFYPVDKYEAKEF